MYIGVINIPLTMREKAYDESASRSDNKFRPNNSTPGKLSTARQAGVIACALASATSNNRLSMLAVHKRAKAA